MKQPKGSTLGDSLIGKQTAVRLHDVANRAAELEALYMENNEAQIVADKCNDTGFRFYLSGIVLHGDTAEEMSAANPALADKKSRVGSLHYKHKWIVSRAIKNGVPLYTLYEGKKVIKTRAQLDTEIKDAIKKAQAKDNGANSDNENDGEKDNAGQSPEDARAVNDSILKKAFELLAADSVTRAAYGAEIQALMTLVLADAQADVDAEQQEQQG
jgi:hypothetical protein